MATYLKSVLFFSAVAMILFGFKGLVSGNERGNVTSSQPTQNSQITPVATSPYVEVIDTSIHVEFQGTNLKMVVPEDKDVTVTCRQYGMITVKPGYEGEELFCFPDKQVYVGVVDEIEVNLLPVINPQADILTWEKQTPVLLVVPPNSGEVAFIVTHDQRGLESETLVFTNNVEAQMFPVSRVYGVEVDKREVLRRANAKTVIWYTGGEYIIGDDQIIACAVQCGILYTYPGDTQSPMRVDTTYYPNPSGSYPVFTYHVFNYMVNGGLIVDNVCTLKDMAEAEAAKLDVEIEFTTWLDAGNPDTNYGGPKDQDYAWALRDYLANGTTNGWTKYFYDRLLNNNPDLTDQEVVDRLPICYQ